MKKIFLTMLIFCLLLAVPIMAKQDSPLPTNFIRERTQSSFLPFAIVNNGQCNAMPSDAGCVIADGSTDCDMYNLQKFTDKKVFCGGSTGLTGCRICWYNSAYKSLGCKDMDPNSNQYAPTSAVYWERYDCFQSECMEKSEFQDVGCGKEFCNNDANLMLREREDSCGNVDRECINSDKCRTGQCRYQVGLWSACANGVQTREVTYAGCNKATETKKCESTVQDSWLMQQIKSFISAITTDLNNDLPIFALIIIGLLIAGYYFAKK